MINRSKRSFKSAARKAVLACALVTGVITTPAFATGQSHEQAPVVFGASGVGVGSGWTDGWAGMTGSGPNLRGGTYGEAHGASYGGADAGVRGRTDFCPGGCGDLRGQVDAWGGSSQHVATGAFGSTHGAGPQQMRVGTDTAAHGTGAAAGRFDFPARSTRGQGR